MVYLAIGRLKLWCKMAFETVDQWQIERRVLPSFDAPLIAPLASGHTARKRLRTITSAACALCVQAAFFYLLIAGLAGRFSEQSNSSVVDHDPVTMIPINQNRDNTEMRADSPSDSATSLPETRIPKVESSSTTELPAEWALARMSVPREIDGKEIPENVLPRSENREIYDPFAGAAPNRKTASGGSGQSPEPELTLAGRIAGFFGSEAKQNRESAFEQWVEELRARLPRATGSVELSVVLSQDGKVVSGNVIGGSASPQVKFFVRNAVVGKHFSGLTVEGKGGIVRLPSVKLG